jgi:hypothetical protein
VNLWKWYTKALLTNRFLWSWGIAFMLFWLVIGAFLESQGFDLHGPSTLLYTSSWYAIIVILSLSMLAVAVSSSLTYGSAALSYSFRYTRLTPGGFLFSLVGGSAVLGFFLSFLMLGATVGVFGARFGRLLLPSNVLGLLGVSLLAGVFMMALATVLLLVVINYLGLKSTSFVAFVPLLLSYAFGLGQVYAPLPAWLLYGSPYNDLTSLLYEGYAGRPTPVEISTSSASVLSWPWLVVALLAWTLVLTGVAAFLLPRIRSRQLEEGRQV